MNRDADVSARNERPRKQELPAYHHVVVILRMGEARGMLDVLAV